MAGFVECPNCRCLIEASAGACRVCATPLAPAAPGAGIGRASLAGASFAGPGRGRRLARRAGLVGARVVGGMGIRIAAALVIAAVAAITSLGGGDDRYPDAWDPTIAPLAEFVATERGLAFAHPVHVDFLDEDTFRDLVSAPERVRSADAAAVAEDNERLAGFYRALGLVSGSYDPDASSRALTGDGAAAFYSDRTKRVTVRGATLDPAMRMTLVHELTHALQDQHFDLGRRRAQLEPDQHDGFQAIVEGDAERIAYAYYDEMTPADQASVDGSFTREDHDETYGSHPPALVALFLAPYSLGHPFVEILTEFGKPGAIDEAFLNPPRSTEYLLAPFEYVDGRAPQPVPATEVLESDEIVDEGVMGPLVWYLTLEERLGQKAALAAVDGWGGDSYVAYERADRVCVRATLRGDTPEATTLMGTTFAAWAAAMPSGTASVVTGESVTVDTCDPGAQTPLAASPDAGLDALLLPATRSAIALRYVQSGAPGAVARCAADRITARATLPALAADETDDALDAIIRDASATCAG